jgi:hypothetical protein
LLQQRRCLRVISPNHPQAEIVLRAAKRPDSERRELGEIALRRFQVIETSPA